MLIVNNQSNPKNSLSKISNSNFLLKLLVNYYTNLRFQMSQYYSIQNCKEFTQLELLLLGTGTNFPPHISQKYSLNPHSKFWNDYTTSKMFE